MKTASFFASRILVVAFPVLCLATVIHNEVNGFSFVPASPGVGRPGHMSFSGSRLVTASNWGFSRTRGTNIPCMMAQVSQQEAQKGIDKVVTALRKDRNALSELGKLEKVTIVLGFGSPSPGTLAVRFNAAFRKGGMGRSAVPLPFGLGQSNVTEGRGTMVGQVKASLDSKTGKILSCSVFRDLGYGRAFNLRV